MSKQEILEKNTDVTLGTENGKWWCSAQTGNWANDFFYVEGKTRGEVIKKMRSVIGRDKEEKWLLDNPLLTIEE